eukprot:TRINITY_DN33714_c0_g1_i1.p1 TRINITY_DN33714_c0_g1~~TRINITY_DN33714_c0_g1_i1.p1  ORF type:complete len:2071 (+),score=358.28 TRINITY_DN33714_c0_g1_i1:733-6213(+)
MVEAKEKLDERREQSGALLNTIESANKEAMEQAEVDLAERAKSRKELANPFVDPSEGLVVFSFGDGMLPKNTVAKSGTYIKKAVMHESHGDICRSFGPKSFIDLPLPHFPVVTYNWGHPIARENLNCYAITVHFRIQAAHWPKEESSTCLLSLLDGEVSTEGTPTRKGTGLVPPGIYLKPDGTLHAAEGKNKQYEPSKGEIYDVSLPGSNEGVFQSCKNIVKKDVWHVLTMIVDCVTDHSLDVFLDGERHLLMVSPTHLVADGPYSLPPVAGVRLFASDLQESTSDMVGGDVSMVAFQTRAFAPAEVISCIAGQVAQREWLSANATKTREAIKESMWSYVIGWHLPFGIWPHDTDVPAILPPGENTESKSWEAMRKSWGKTGDASLNPQSDEVNLDPNIVRPGLSVHLRELCKEAKAIYPHQLQAFLHGYASRNRVVFTVASHAALEQTKVALFRHAAAVGRGLPSFDFACVLVDGKGFQTEWQVVSQRLPSLHIFPAEKRDEGETQHARSTRSKLNRNAILEAGIEFYGPWTLPSLWSFFESNGSDWTAQWELGVMVMENTFSSYSDEHDVEGLCLEIVAALLRDQPHASRLMFWAGLHFSDEAVWKTQVDLANARKEIETSLLKMQESGRPMDASAMTGHLRFRFKAPEEGAPLAEGAEFRESILNFVRYHVEGVRAHDEKETTQMRLSFREADEVLSKSLRAYLLGLEGDGIGGLLAAVIGTLRRFRPPEPLEAFLAIQLREGVVTLPSQAASSKREVVGTEAGMLIKDTPIAEAPGLQVSASLPPSRQVDAQLLEKEILHAGKSMDSKAEFQAYLSKKRLSGSAEPVVVPKDAEATREESAEPRRGLLASGRSNTQKDSGEALAIADGKASTSAHPSVEPKETGMGTDAFWRKVFHMFLQRTKIPKIDTCRLMKEASRYSDVKFDSGGSAAGGGLTLFHAACLGGRLSVLRELLAPGPARIDPNTTARVGALCLNSSPSGVLDTGCDVLAGHTVTGLELAAAANHAYTCKELLAQGAHLGKALHVAAMFGSTGAATSLLTWLDGITKLRAVNGIADGFSPLGLAVLGNHGGLVKILLDAKADPLQKLSDLAVRRLKFWPSYTLGILSPMEGEGTSVLQLSLRLGSGRSQLCRQMVHFLEEQNRLKYWSIELDGTLCACADRPLVFSRQDVAMNFPQSSSSIAEDFTSKPENRGEEMFHPKQFWQQILGACNLSMPAGERMKCVQQLREWLRMLVIQLESSAGKKRQLEVGAADSDDVLALPSVVDIDTVGASGHDIPTGDEDEDEDTDESKRKQCDQSVLPWHLLADREGWDPIEVCAFCCSKLFLPDKSAVPSSEKEVDGEEGGKPSFLVAELLRSWEMDAEKFREKGERESKPSSRVMARQGRLGICFWAKFLEDFDLIGLLQLHNLHTSELEESALARCEERRLEFVEKVKTATDDVAAQVSLTDEKQCELDQAIAANVETTEEPEYAGQSSAEICQQELANAKGSLLESQNRAACSMLSKALFESIGKDDRLPEYFLGPAAFDQGDSKSSWDKTSFLVRMRSCVEVLNLPLTGSLTYPPPDLVACLTKVSLPVDESKVNILPSMAALVTRAKLFAVRAYLEQQHDTSSADFELWQLFVLRLWSSDERIPQCARRSEPEFAPLQELCQYVIIATNATKATEEMLTLFAYLPPAVLADSAATKDSGPLTRLDLNGGGGFQVGKHLTLPVLSTLTADPTGVWGLCQQHKGGAVLRLQISNARPTWPFSICPEQREYMLGEGGCKLVVKHIRIGVSGSMLFRSMDKPLRTFGASSVLQFPVAVPAASSFFDIGSDVIFVDAA